jgi:hypothetical protein
MNASSFTVGNTYVVLSQHYSVPSNSLVLAGAISATSKGIALGESAKVLNGSGTGSVAIGRFAETNANAGTAIGPSAKAWGNDSSAFGSASFSNGASSLAIGHQALSNGSSSASLGIQTISSGWQSVSIGYKTTACSASQTVVGRYNLPASLTPETTPNFEDSSITFVIGNGYKGADDVVVKQNALTIRRDNGTAIGTQVASGAGGQVVVGRYNVSRADGAFIVGAGASETPRNALRVTDGGMVLVQPDGDISMGEFQSGEQP